MGELYNDFEGNFFLSTDEGSELCLNFEKITSKKLSEKQSMLVIRLVNDTRHHVFAKLHPDEYRDAVLDIQSMKNTLSKLIKKADSSEALNFLRMCTRNRSSTHSDISTLKSPSHMDSLIESAKVVLLSCDDAIDQIKKSKDSWRDYDEKKELVIALIHLFYELNLSVSKTREGVFDQALRLLLGSVAHTKNGFNVNYNFPKDTFPLIVKGLGDYSPELVDERFRSENQNIFL